MILFLRGIVSVYIYISATEMRERIIFLENERKWIFFSFTKMDSHTE